MKKFNKIIRGRVVLGLGALLLLVTSCVFLDSVEYPDQLVAGQSAEFTMNVRMEVATDISDQKLIIAVMMPPTWNPASNVTLTYTSSLDEGPQTMSLIPEDVLPAGGNGLTWPEHLKAKFGAGPNANQTMQWVAFQSDKSYDLVDDQDITAAVKITTLVGNENLKAQLGFFVNNSGDGLNDQDRWKVQYSDCMTVTGATGSLVDYCTGQTAGIGEVAAAVSGKPYPNPFTTAVSFPLNLAAGTDFEVTVFDITGKKVKSATGTANSNSHIFTLGADDLTSGLYLISVKSDKGTANFKVVKN